MDKITEDITFLLEAMGRGQQRREEEEVEQEEREVRENIIPSFVSHLRDNYNIKIMDLIINYHFSMLCPGSPSAPQLGANTVW